MLKRVVLGLFLMSMTLGLLPFFQINTIVQGQQQASNLPNYNLYLPNAYLQYGPSPEQAVPLFLRSAQFNGENNESITVYDPATSIDNLTTSIVLYLNETVKPTFDSYFMWNRFVSQDMPTILNASVELSLVLNPDIVNFWTQAELAPPITLANPINDNMSFVIPQSLDEGLYLADLTVFFPDYSIHATYSNGAYIMSNINSTFVGSNSTYSSNTEDDNYYEE